MYVSFVEINVCVVKKTTKKTLNIAGTDVLMEIETGSRCSVINRDTFKSLKDDLTLLKSNGKLTTYYGRKYSSRRYSQC